MTLERMDSSSVIASSGEPLDFPLHRACPYEPPTQYSALRAEQPMTRVRVPNGQIAWLVTRYEDVRSLLTDPRVSSDRGHPNFPLTENVTPQTRLNVAAADRSLVGLDPPEHGVRRRMLVTEFTFRRVQELRPYMQQVVDSCIERLLASPRPADLVTTVSMPVPSMVLCELLGVPYTDSEFIERSTAAMVSHGTPPKERQQAAAGLGAYLDKLITAKEADPTDDLLGRLIAHSRETSAFDHQLIVALARLLFVAGHGTTMGMISLGVVDLLIHPEQLAQIIADPSSVAAAVEELLRYASVVDAMPRMATADIEVGDVTVRAGEGLLISFAAANWDPEVFPAASDLNLQSGNRKHVAFGYGVHQCIGQNLARELLQIVFRTLFTRVPGLRLAASMDELPFRRDSNIYGIEHLPVTW